MKILMIYRGEDKPSIECFKTYDEFKSFIKELGELNFLSEPPRNITIFPTNSAFVVYLADGFIITSVDS